MNQYEEFGANLYKILNLHTNLLYFKTYNPTGKMLNLILLIIVETCVLFLNRSAKTEKLDLRLRQSLVCLLQFRKNVIKLKITVLNSYDTYLLIFP